MAAKTNTTIRMFGALHTFRKNQGLEPQTEVAIPPEGKPACEVARELGLPMDKIEAVFINRIAHPLQQVIHAGDRVAFVPTGIPGPHRFLLGIFDAGKQGTL